MADDTINFNFIFNKLFTNDTRIVSLTELTVKYLSEELHASWTLLMAYNVLVFSNNIVTSFTSAVVLGTV